MARLEYAIHISHLQQGDCVVELHLNTEFLAAFDNVLEKVSLMNEELSSVWGFTYNKFYRYRLQRFQVEYQAVNYKVHLVGQLARIAETTFTRRELDPSYTLLNCKFL